MDSKDLSVELKRDQPSYMVLRGTYGEKIYKAFGMTRQGVRWRFWRVMNDIYVSAFESILFVENVFGTQLREHAIRISRERYALRQEAARTGFRSADTLRSKDTEDQMSKMGKMLSEQRKSIERQQEFMDETPTYIR